MPACQQLASAIRVALRRREHDYPGLKAFGRHGPAPWSWVQAMQASTRGTRDRRLAHEHRLARAGISIRQIDLFGGESVTGDLIQPCDTGFHAIRSCR